MVVLEHLARTLGGTRLRELAAALSISPSSLLALLTTLRTGGYVVRGDDERYRIGPGLVALGAAAARLDPDATFRHATSVLLQALGETVLLWRPEGEQAVVVAAREGWQQVRFVPRVGQQVVLAGSALAAALASGAVSSGVLEPGVAVVALAVEDPRSGEPLVLSVVGPAHRVDAERVEEPLRSAATSLGRRVGTSTLPGDVRRQAGALLGAELAAFLGEPHVANLGYLNEAGYPSTVPVWYEWDGEAFWLLPGPGARWAAHLERVPHVSLTISEAAAPLRRVNAEGTARVVHQAARARQLQARLARRYAQAVDVGLAWPRTTRSVVRIAPTRLVGWRGLRLSDRHTGVA